MKHTILPLALLGAMAATMSAQELDYNTLTIPRFDPVHTPSYAFGNTLIYMEDFGTNGAWQNAVPDGVNTYYIQSGSVATWNAERTLTPVGGSSGLYETANVAPGGNITNNGGTGPAWYTNTPTGDPRFTSNYLQFFAPSEEFGTAPSTYGPGDPMTYDAYSDTAPVGATLDITNAPGGLLSLSGRLLANGDLTGTDHVDSFYDSGLNQTISSLAALGADAFQITIRDGGGGTLAIYNYEFDNDNLLDTPGWLTRVWDATGDDPTLAAAGYTGDTSIGDNPADADSIYEFDLEFGNGSGGDLSIEFAVLGGYKGVISGDNFQQFFGLDDLILQSVLTPEPSSMILFGVAVFGLGGVAFYRRRK